jgi:hypothetical protein
MDDATLTRYLQSMEKRIIDKIKEAQADIIEEMETSLMEVGVYKKEIMDKINRTMIKKTPTPPVRKPLKGK